MWHFYHKNSTIQNFIDLFTNIRIKTSVTDEILIEHLRRDTREKNIDEINARIWRDEELAATDNISQTPDFPNRDKYLTYRQALRDWPSTADFPAKKPALE